MGLELGSRVFLDLDSDLEVPRTILEIFCTVRSVIDSVRDSLGDLTLEALESEPAFNRTSSLAGPLVAAASVSLADPDLVTLAPSLAWSEEELGPELPWLPPWLRSECLKVARILSVML